MKILTIQLWHNAAVSYTEDGVLKYVIQEEKFDNIKNSSNFPLQTIKYIAQKHDLHNLDKIVIPTYWLHPGLLEYINPTDKKPHSIGAVPKIKAYDTFMYYVFKAFPFLMKHIDRFMIAYWKKLYYKTLVKQLQSVLWENITEDTIDFVEHHVAHALSPVYFYGLHKQAEPVLIFTLDGRGDTSCATVKIRENGKLRNIAESSNNNSLWFLRSLITMMMGMKPLEHEYKIMWLAAYAEEKYFSEVYNSIFKDLIRIDWLQWKARVPMNRVNVYLQDKFYGKRFDNIAGALQYCTEKLVLERIKNAIDQTWITTIATSWGVFMNVKLNKRIQEAEYIKKVYFMPSCGDESNVIGGVLGCYLNNAKSIDELVPLHSMYYGLRYDENEYGQFVKTIDASKYNVVHLGNDEETAEKVSTMLANFDIIGVVRWAWERGARSLCNRAILSNASSLESFHKINDMIKMRDFWMPFAPVILEEYAERYIIDWNTIGKRSWESHQYMISAVDSTPIAQKHLIASIHQKDKTLRPQIVNAKSNARMYNVLKKYEAKTGFWWMMNTSLNIHGYPMVWTLDQAMFTLEKSWMQNLLLGNYLVTKK